MPTALITGGAKRLGAAIAGRLHDAGWRVIIHCLNSVNEARLMASIMNKSRPGSAEVIIGDLASDAGADDIICQAIKLGEIDVLINSASMAIRDCDMTNDLKLATFQCNALSPYRLATGLAGQLSKNNGAIINLLDVRSSSLNPWPGWAHYTASKGALELFGVSLAKELAPAVRVNAVSPGITLPFSGEPWTEAEASSMNARSLLGRIASPENIADAVFFLATSKHITGQTLTVDGGERLKW